MPIRHRDVFDNIPQRLKSEVNPYVQELIAGQAEGQLPTLYGPHLKGMQGRWQEVLGPRSGGIILEIGIHKGLCLTAMAKAHPECSFVGLDITFKRVVMSARRCRLAGLENVLTVLADARHLPTLFAPGELAGIVAFFPDPWSKKQSQKHNRLFTHEFCTKMHGALKPGGFFWLKTDAAAYFNETQAYLAAAGFAEPTQKPLICQEVYVSTFEKAFKQEGLQIYEGVWHKTQ